MANWLPMNRLPVNAGPVKYWQSVHQIVHSSNFRQPAVGLRSGEPIRPESVPLSWQPPIARGSADSLLKGTS